MSTEELFFNGVNGTTGDYLQPPLTPAEVAQIAQGEKDREHIKVLQNLDAQFSEGSFGPISEVEDPSDLAQAGWGVIFPLDKNGNTVAIKDALKELLDHREGQAGKYYKEYFGNNAYIFPHTAGQFLAEHGAEPSQPANPEKVPYYLLIVGDPEEIPFEFQYQLDVQYAVGRIYFDTLEEYAQYAQSVVAAETGKVSLPRQAKFFGVENEGDEATKQSARDLVKSLSGWAETKFKPKGWNLETFLATETTKARLGNLLGGSETPAFLFTASHGLDFSSTKRADRTGALLCNDWYRGYQGEIPEDWYFSADDISSNAKLLGLIAFHFACFGAGTPKEDVFGFRDSRNPGRVVNNWRDIAPKSSVARLPQKLLSHPNGGALAVIGHIDRAWNQSFSWNSINEKAGVQLDTFQSTLFLLMSGKRLGFALEEMNKRYAALSTDLANLFERKTRLGGSLDSLTERSLVYKWTANNDARGYAIIGDPAVRLAVGEDGTSQTERPTLERVVFTRTVSPPSVHSSSVPESNSAPEVLDPASSLLSSELPLPASDYATGAADAEYGLFDASMQARERLSQALNQFTTKLAIALQQAVDNTTSLEVSTYTSDDMTGVTYSVTSGKFEGTAKLRALTRIAFDGDTVICVPEKEGKVDEALWKIHVDMVQQAQTHRAELLKVLASTAAGLLDTLKVV